MYCKKCGNEINQQSLTCQSCGATEAIKKSRVAYVLLGLFLGGLGIHNFYAGYTTKAIVQLLLMIFASWLVFPAIAICIWVIIELFTVKKDAKGVDFS